MIIVTGMHRSGTSLACQLLYQAGFDFDNKDPFYPTDLWNIYGYFEVRRIMDLNSRLITGVPKNKNRVSSILSQCIYITMPKQSIIQKRAVRFFREIEKVGKDYEQLTVKDPRFCLTLPFWMDACNVEKIVVCIRHPEHVARSLRRRQHLPRRLALAFWSYHLRSLLENLPLDRAWFFNVDKLAAGEALEELEGLWRFLGLATERHEMARAYRNVFHAELISKVDNALPPLPENVQALWKHVVEIAPRNTPGFVSA